MLVVILTAVNALLAGVSGYLCLRTRKTSVTALAVHLQAQEEGKRVLESITVQAQEHASNALIASRAAQISSGHASDDAIVSRLSSGQAVEAVSFAKRYSVAAAFSAEKALEHEIVSLSASKASEQHRKNAEAQAEVAQSHAATAGTLSVAVTAAAQKAATKTQKQAECSACQRSVNSYVLRGDGRVVCKWCSDRNRG